MVSPRNLIRKHLHGIKAYSSARDEYTGKVGVFLDANENAVGSASTRLYNRYPDPHHKELKAIWSKLKGVRADQVFFGNGSDEPIDLLIRMFCEPGVDHIITMPPTYGMYEVSAAINAVENVQVPLDQEFHIRYADLEARWSEKSKMIFICSPNNPSGNLLREQDIKRILKGFPGIVVIDEAYIDFSPEASWAAFLEEYPQLVILQTMSKAWGMAGIRVGVAMGDPWVIAMLEKIKPPYNLSLANQQLALEALQNENKKNAAVAVLLSERERLTSKLSAMEIVKKIHPSDANFILVEFENAQDVFKYLIDSQLIVRDRSKQMHCEGCLRVTVGVPQENERLIDLLKGFT